jgi:hypothetical protein
MTGFARRSTIWSPSTVDADPGRFRNAAFFMKMYGDCRAGEVTPHLVSLPWLPKTWGKSIRITSVNGVERAHHRPARPANSAAQDRRRR